MFMTVGSSVSGVSIGGGQVQVTPHATGVQGQTNVLNNNTIIQTLGHSISGSGPGTYHYQVGGTGVVNSGTIFYGPGGSGRINLISDSYVVNVMQFGARGDSVTNDTTAIMRAVNYAGNLGLVYRRPLLYFPPGRRYVVSKLDIPSFIDVEMTGAVLLSASTEYDKPILSIGSSADGSYTANLGGKFTGLNVQYNGAPSGHGYPESSNNDYYGVRIINALQCTIEVLEVNNFYGGVQLLSSGISGWAPCAHNTVTIGSIYGCKVGLDLQSRVSGYTNENLILNGNFSPGSILTNYGSTYGVRFSTDGVYHGQNNNVFMKPCFQLGSTKLDWSAGLSIGLNYRVYYNGNEYLATNTGTTGATPPTHTAGTVSDGTINWQYIGSYRRSPVYHKDAGDLNRFIGSRWETSIGSFAVISGAVEGSNVYEYEYYNDIIDGNATRQIEDIEYASSAQMFSAGSFMLQGKDIVAPQSVGINNLHYRAVAGASGWTIAGMGFLHYWTNAFRTYTSGELRLCRDSLYINSYGASMSGFFAVQPADLPYCIVDVQQNHRFRLDRSVGGGLSGNRPGRVYLAPLTDSYSRADFETAGVVNKPVLLATDAAIGIFSGSDIMRTSNDTAVNLSVVAHQSIPYVLVGFYDTQLEGFNVSKLMESYPYFRSNNIGVSCKDILFGDTQRSSVGVPRWGFFGRCGEIISNHAVTTGNIAFWIVTTPGILAPTFNSGASVIKGELRQNSGNVYAVNSAGTAGNSPPTGTGSGISDGTLTWDYIAPTAVLTAGPVL